jgi:hypothetical protein
MYKISDAAALEGQAGDTELPGLSLEGLIDVSGGAGASPTCRSVHSAVSKTR